MTEPTPPHGHQPAYHGPEIVSALPAPPEQCFLMWIATTPPDGYPGTEPVGITTDPDRMLYTTELTIQAVTDQFRTWLLAHGEAHPTGHAWLHLQHLTPTDHPDTHRFHGFTLAIPRLSEIVIP
ncbi:hypothetical protein [Allonocardiopsis opalescens]|uniref:Uncharacterized protein n=1 Tax=Allonocardiopsis opalescens TaxID=1144618 RepID=A0A2T0QCT1_9ACTN|nr:hypothetical protein [Allonocardiopsis opalescens]PRY01708.1 hypothetical protein CLV72_101292 [Allonocardiopsis opalescens]